MVCTSLGSLLRPLFYFLCSILLIHRYREMELLVTNKNLLFIPLCPTLSWTLFYGRTIIEQHATPTPSSLASPASLSSFSHARAFSVV